MPTIITSLTTTTELEAVNACLAAIGESPILDHTTSTQPDVEMAVAELRRAARELQSQPWRFNTEYDLELPATTSSFVWTEPDASTVTLSVFAFPAAIASWNLSPVPEQSGDNHIDVVERPSKQYTPVGTMVFYDRDYNRDGFPADERTSLWIDVRWMFDFEKMPETARRLVTMIAARRFAANMVGSEKLVGFTADDQRLALRNFLREQSPADTANLLDHPDTLFRLGRPRASFVRTTTINRRP